MSRVAHRVGYIKFVPGQGVRIICERFRKVEMIVRIVVKKMVGRQKTVPRTHQHSEW